jgi:hypothetical protein
MTFCYHLRAEKANICTVFLNYRRFWDRWRSLGESNPCFSLERAVAPQINLSSNIIHHLLVFLLVFDRSTSYQMIDFTYKNLMHMVAAGPPRFALTGYAWHSHAEDHQAEACPA